MVQLLARIVYKGKAILASRVKFAVRIGENICIVRTYAVIEGEESHAKIIKLCNLIYHFSFKPSGRFVYVAERTNYKAFVLGLVGETAL